MRSFIFLFIIYFFTTPAFSEEPLKEQINKDITEFQSLVEQSLAYRAETLRVYKYIKHNLDNDIPLTGNDIETLNNGMQLHLTLRKAFYQIVYYYKYLLDDTSAKIDSETRLKGVMLSLSAALILYDNYLLSISIFEEDATLRRYLNARHNGYNIDKSQLANITKEYNSVSNRKKMRRAIHFFEKQWLEQKKDFKENPETAYLYLLIKQSPSYNSTLNVSPLYVINSHLKFFSGVSTDSLTSLGSDGINLFSLFFGNSVGIIQTRKGLLQGKKDVQKDIQQQLKAGDILLEKTPFRLTDKLIPGYWGHVAIWAGSRKELEELGIWNHPVVKKYHTEIISSKGIIEALRSGVQVNSLEHFLNIDDFALLRRNNISDRERAKTIIRALRQIGKAYDFNFDIETNDRLVCSELIYVAYINTEWPTDAALGRHTISPAHIAEKAGHKLPFRVISLYLGGKKINKKINENFQNLKRNSTSSL